MSRLRVVLLMLAGLSVVGVVRRLGSSDVPAPPAAVAAIAPARVAPAPVITPIAPTGPRRPERVLIISIDGLRPDVIDDARAPRTAQLIREGARARRAETIPQSDTLPSHASMLSGVGAKAHGLWWNSYQHERGFIHVPTIFSIARTHGKSTAMFVGKPKLRHIARPGTVDHYERSSYLCGGVTRRAAAYFVAKKPDLMFVHYSDPDEAGHAKGWMSPEYLKSVRDADHCLAKLLAAVDASELGASSLIIVTADHGGHRRRHSGGHTALERDIPWIVRGPGVVPGAFLDNPIRTFDTAATALAALRLPPPPNMIGQAALTFTP